MPDGVTNVVVLGSTGSIGRSTLEVIRHCGDPLCGFGLSALSSVELLAEQARQMNPRWVAVADALAAARFERSLLPRGTRLLSDEAELADAIAAPEVDVVVSAVVGSAGLRGTWAALEAGKRVALANKETLVMAGQLASRLARDRDAEIIPVDSEHSAIFQALRAGKREHLRRVILTASGGPFRHHSSAALSQVTVEEALNHPTWEMGRKITVDSATMMNKALEIIEARWLFDLDADQISVAIHPQSIVHSLVEFVDGSVVAQMSPPDMRLPIQYALTYPDRQPSVARKMDFSGPFTLEFEPPDFDRFPALGLGLEAARAGGTAGAVLSAANEAAVEGFLAGELQFPDITSVCRAVLDHHSFDANPSLVQLEALDRWARQEVTRWVCT